MKPEDDILLEALEVLINCILYTRRVYPEQIFEKRKIYNCPVFISIYPILNNYLLNIFKTIQNLKNHKDLHKIELIIYRNEFEIYENYIFEIDDKNSIVYQEKCKNDEYLIEFEENIRKSLLKLSNQLNILKKLPNDAKFKINLHTTQSGFIKMTTNPLMQEFPWLQETENDSDDKLKISILPLTALNLVGLQIYAEVY